MRYCFTIYSLTNQEKYSYRSKWLNYRWPNVCIVCRMGVKLIAYYRYLSTRCPTTEGFSSIRNVAIGVSHLLFDLFTILVYISQYLLGLYVIVYIYEFLTKYKMKLLLPRQFYCHAQNNMVKEFVLLSWWSS